MSKSGQPISNADHPQLQLFGGAPTSSIKRTTVRANKKPKQSTQSMRASVRAVVRLPIVGSWFQPKTGVPANRNECPDTTQNPCPYVRCRYHLFLEDAEHRAGRPGLASVPRDARGWTISQPGDMGGEGPGTSLMARWLELERSAKVQVVIDEQGEVVEALPYQPLSARDQARWILHNKHVGTLDTLLPFLRIGEPMRVYNDNGEQTCTAELTSDGALKFSGRPGGLVVNLVRERGVESCALDAIKRQGAMSNHDAGECLARHRTLIARENRGALMKACETAEEVFGIEREDFVGALMRMGESK